MNELLNELKEITELLYQEKIAKANGKLLETLALLAKYIERIENNVLQQEIICSLNEAVIAMEKEDYTLLADILQYDIMEKIESMGE